MTNTNEFYDDFDEDMNPLPTKGEVYAQRLQEQMQEHGRERSKVNQALEKTLSQSLDEQYIPDGAEWMDYIYTKVPLSKVTAFKKGTPIFIPGVDTTVYTPLGKRQIKRDPVAFSIDNDSIDFGEDYRTPFDIQELEKLVKNMKGEYELTVTSFETDVKDIPVRGLFFEGKQYK